ncbi:MAG: hypothetical protein GY757_41795 [bacterium]|nr:hypothetical protein [bacterium]
MDFNSNLLKAFPRPAPARKRVVRPLFMLFFLVLVVGTPVFVAITRYLPPTDFGYAVYWLHDNIYLPVKGFSYTYFFPISLLFWGPLLFLIILKLFSYLFAYPVFKHLQVFFARKAVRKRFLHLPLVKTSGRLKKWRMKPLLLSQVAAEQREKSVSRLKAMPLAEDNRKVFSSAVALTGLHTRLITLPPAGQADHLEALVYWHDIYKQLRHRFKNGGGHERLEKPIKRLAAQIDPSRPGFMRSLLSLADRKSLELSSSEPGSIEGFFVVAKEKGAGFDALTIAVDLIYLAALENDRIAGYVLGGEIPAEKRVPLIVRRLAVSTAARRELLDRNRADLENSQERYGGNVIHGDPAELPLLGRLALSIALDLSLILGDSRIGEGFMESIETLDFVLYQWQPERLVSKVPTGLQRLALVIDGLPGAGDFLFCGELADIEVREQKAIWLRSGSGGGEVVREDDFRLAEARVQALYHAAGPEYDRETKTVGSWQKEKIKNKKSRKK